MAEEVLDIEPESLSGKDCNEFSTNPQLRKKYEDKWGHGITGLCDIDKSE